MAAANDEASKARGEALLAAANAEKAKAEEMERDAQRQFDLEQARATTLISTYRWPSIPPLQPCIPTFRARDRRSPTPIARRSGSRRRTRSCCRRRRRSRARWAAAWRLDASTRPPADHSLLTARRSHPLRRDRWATWSRCSRRRIGRCARACCSRRRRSARWERARPRPSRRAGSRMSDQSCTRAHQGSPKKAQPSPAVC